MKKIKKANIIYLHSDALKKISYNESKKVLEATFINGKTYQYLQVPQNVWEEFLLVIHSKESAGAFINKQIKPSYKYREIK